MRIIKNREIVQTAWLHNQPTDENPDGRQLLSLSVWLEWIDNCQSSGSMDPLPGVMLEPNEDLESISRWISLIPVIAINVGNFADGRIYSLAVELRQFYRYTGELRAIDAIYDNLSMLEKCGFDAFALQEGQSAEEGLSYFSEFDFEHPLWLRDFS